VGLALLVAACGVKAPPRPPLPEVPAADAGPASPAASGGAGEEGAAKDGARDACQDDECVSEEERARRQAPAVPSADPRTTPP
jgi:hypothetical protein